MSVFAKATYAHKQGKSQMLTLGVLVNSFEITGRDLDEC